MTLMPYDIRLFPASFQIISMAFSQADIINCNWQSIKGGIKSTWIIIIIWIRNRHLRYADYRIFQYEKLGWWRQWRMKWHRWFPAANERYESRIYAWQNIHNSIKQICVWRSEPCSTFHKYGFSLFSETVFMINTTNIIFCCSIMYTAIAANTVEKHGPIERQKVI